MNESRVNDNLYNTFSAFDNHNNYVTYDTSNPIASINQNGVSPTVAFQTMNSMFDNVIVKSNLGDLETNSLGVVNVKYNRDGVEGGHAVAVDGYTYISNNQKIYKITDAQNISDSEYYMESQFNENLEVYRHYILLVLKTGIIRQIILHFSQIFLRVQSLHQILMIQT